MNLTQEMSEFLVPEILDDLTHVEKELFEHLQSDPPLLGEIAHYLIAAGGKRVRPAFVLLGFRAAGGEDIEGVVPIAAAIELIHTASLIHDDINDGSHMRRGQETTNRKYGNTNALVAGDYLFVKAFRIGGMYDWEVVKMIADACAQLAEGEVLQDGNRFNTDLSLSEYLVTIEKKTASLITSCVKVGAFLSGAEQPTVDALAAYAHNVGMSFQITDDILDVKGSSTSIGKPRGNDIAEGQLSIVLIKALEMLDETLAEELRSIIKLGSKSPEQISRAIDLVLSTRALEESYILAQQYSDTACAELMKLPESDYRDNLELLNEMIIQRYY
jgi:geranylgeranyl pyrophosphate synthase